MDSILISELQLKGKERSSGSYIHITEDHDGIEDKGQLILLFDFHGIDKGKKIIADLAEEIEENYYAQISKKPARALEFTLQELNKTIKKALPAKAKINQLGVLVGVLDNTELHFASTNDMAVLLLRDGQLIDVVSSAGGEESQGDKIFSNIVSGQLETNDRVLLGTGIITDLLSTDTIENCLEIDDPDKCTEELSTALEDSDHEPPIEAMALYIVDDEEIEEEEEVEEDILLENETEEEEIDEEPEESEEDEIEEELPEDEEEIEEVEDEKTEEEIEPEDDEESEEELPDSEDDEILGGDDEEVDEIQDEELPEDEELEEEIIEDEESTESQMDDLNKTVQEQIRSARKSSSRHGIPRKKDLSNDILPPLDEDADNRSKKSIWARFKKTKAPQKVDSPMPPKKLKPKLNIPKIKLPQWFGALHNSSKILLTIAAVLALIFIINIFRHGSDQKIIRTGEEFTKIASEVREKVQTAQNSRILSRNDEARNLLTDAFGVLNTSDPVSEDQISEKEELETLIDEELERIRLIIRVNDAELLGSFDSLNPANTVHSINLFSNGLYGISTNRTVLSKLNINDGKISEATSNLSDDDGMSLLTVTDNGFLLLSNKGTLLSYTVNEGTFHTESTDFPTAGVKLTDMFAYGGRLYTLDANKNQILKHNRTAGGYSSGSSWIKDGTDVSHAKGLTIDSNVYLADNNLTKLFTGKKESYTLGSIDPAIESIDTVRTELNWNYIYLLDSSKNRILKIDKETGKLVNQYMSDKFTNLIDIDVNEETGKLYILNDTDVYTISIR